MLTFFLHNHSKLVVHSTSGQLLGDEFAVSASTLIEVGSVLVAHLPATLASAVLAPFEEAGVPVGPDDAVVEPGSVDVAHRVFGVLARVVLDETEAARSSLVLVEAHHDALHVASARKQFVDLLLGREERQVADVECGAGEKKLLQFPPTASVLLIAVATQFYRSRQIPRSFDDRH